ncbi:MAG: protein translocase subunit secF/protein translocase subunit secD, partial [Armatimonadetes bacterium]|nr:protein translocase subunit secF/protein translocase subunit secD [Armatimonadota bacterium]
MKRALTVLLLVVLAAASFWYSLSPKFPVAQGLDLRGGMRVVLEPDTAKLDPGTKIDGETMGKVRDVLENRVNSFGLSGSEVRLKGDRQVVILLPGVQKPQEAMERLSTVAQLEFRHLNNVISDRNAGARYRMTHIPGNPEKGEADKYTFTDTADNKPVPAEEVIEQAPLIVKGNSLKPSSEAQISPSNGQPQVTFEFNSEGAQTFATFTTENVGEILAVVLDKEIISAPNINEPITEGHGQISGGFTTMAEARVLANLLNSGALPIALRAAESQFVGATLGQESIDKSIHAGIIGLGLVLAFMLLYYWLPGFLACIALVLYSALTFSIFKGMGIFPPIVLDLPSITGFILSVGMAVDANILIFERLKEELKAGKPVHAAVDAGFNRAFSSILDSNVTTWIVCAILIWLGAPIIKGFAITLSIGVAVSMFTAITATRTLLHFVMSMPWGRNESLFGLNVGWLNLFFPAARTGGILRVFSKRKVNFGFSILLAILSAVFIAMTPFGMGIKPGIDFTGGTVIEAGFHQPVTRDQVVAALPKGVEAVVSIARSEQPGTRASIEIQGLSDAEKPLLQER